MCRSRTVVRVLTAVCAFALVALGATAARSAPSTYHEPYRPQFHFTPKQNWMNDPNGPIYYRGQYHLFFQYNPAGTTWGNISWGHAVSKDLVHWKELPVAIPEDADEYVFSGSVVYDKGNTSGLGSASNPPLVAIYTSALKVTGIQRQSLAYSTDGGTTWTRYAGNPILDLNSTSCRDPKVFWYPKTNRWVMAVALSDQHKVSIYTSADLRSWVHTSDFGPAGATGGQWECPALVPVKVRGTNQTKWVLVVGTNPGAYAGGSGDQYFVGDFDGTSFTSDDPATYSPPPTTPIGAGDFEGADYGDWATAGAAFGNAPAHSAIPTNGAVGHGWVDSFGSADADTGTLTSPAFTIDQAYLNFLIGGGNHPYVAGGLTSPPAGTTVEDFEGTSLPGWTGTGSFTGITPAQERLPGQVGGGVLDTCQAGCDAAQGTITSPPFTITARYLDLLTAGGAHPLGEAMPTAVAVLVDGKVVGSATGNDSGSLNWRSIDLAAYAGRQAQVQVVDESDGSNGWGHLIVDNLVLSDTAATSWADQTGANLIVDGKIVRSATGAGSPDLDWKSWDLRDLQGKQAQVQLVDQNSGTDWGHTIADDFGLAAAPALSSVQRAHWLDYGADMYAATTFNDLPNGRQIAIGWMNNWNYAQDIPTAPWRSATTIPRELGLEKIGGRLQLTQRPVSELDGLDVRTPHAIVGKEITGTAGAGVKGTALDLDVTFTPHGAKRFGIDVLAGDGQRTRIGYERTPGAVFVDRTQSGDAAFNASFAGVQRAPMPLRHGTLHLRILVDRSSVEVFADKGNVVLTDQVFPDTTSTGVGLFAEGGTVSVSGTATHLRSIWR